MTEILAAWVRAIAGAALISAMAMALTPSGKVKNILKLVCGVLLIIAMISPLLNRDLPGISMDIARYRAIAEEISGEAEAANRNLNRTFIEQRCATYILDKAQSMDISLHRVNVTVKWGDEGFWYPHEVSIKADISEYERAKLRNSIETELGIPGERQYWSAYEEE